MLTLTTLSPSVEDSWESMQLAATGLLHGSLLSFRRAFTWLRTTDLFLVALTCRLFNLWSSSFVRSIRLGYARIDEAFLTSFGAAGAAGALHSLARVDFLRCVRLTGKGLEEFGRGFGRTLRSVDFELSNVAASDVLAMVKHCPELTSLGVRYADTLTDDGLAELLANMTRLESLSLQGSRMVTALHAEGAPHLQTLCLSSCQWVDDNAVKSITTLSMLSELDLSKCKLLTNQGILDLCGLPTQSMRATLSLFELQAYKQESQPRVDLLRSLNFNDCCLYCGSLDTIARRCTNLHTLGMDTVADNTMHAICLPHMYTCTTDSAVAVLSLHIVGLTSLSLRKARGLSDDGMATLATLKQLTMLNVSDSGLLGSSSDGLAALRGLRSLDASYCCSRISATNLALMMLGSSTSLTSLSLAECSLRRKDTFPRRKGFASVVAIIASNCTLLRKLSLRNCPDVSDDCIFKLAAAACAPLLHDVNLSSNEDVLTDAAISALVQATPNLTALDVGVTHGSLRTRITDLSVAAIASALPHLASLSLAHCALSQRSIAILVAAPCVERGALRRADLQGCGIPIVDDAGNLLRVGAHVNTSELRDAMGIGGNVSGAFLGRASLEEEAAAQARVKAALQRATPRRRRRLCVIS